MCNVPGFSDIIGQKRPIRLLQTFLRRATLPHALLFTGIAGIGKRSTAKAVAMALNCRAAGNGVQSAEACGRCQPCRQILADNHPDIIQIAPRAGTLRIDQVRKLLGLLAMKPHSAKQRVVIIADSHSMNPEAANALLKVLEEPPANTTLILTAIQKSDLLPTILSRCRHISFHPLDENELTAHLISARHVDDTVARQAAAMAAGSLVHAERMADMNWQRQRQWVIRASGLEAPVKAASRSMTEALAFSAQLSGRKDQVQELLDVLKIWIRDLIVWPYQPSLILNTDYQQRLGPLRAALDDTCLLALWMSVEKAQKAIAARANLRLTLDVMVISMSKSMPR
jgi:DNA polymerase-3 subunit delta'